jgi:hypothetical protein
MPSLNAMAKDARNKKATAPKKITQKVSPPADLSTEFVQESDMEEDGTDNASSSGDEELLQENSAAAAPKVNGKASVPVADSSSSNGSDRESADEEDEDEEPSKTVQNVSAASKPTK